MVMLAVKDVKQGLGRLLIASEGSQPQAGFSRVVIDSRQAQMGDLFFALRGQHHDGHDFLAEAVGRGAAGVVVARPPTEVPEQVTIFHVSDTRQALQYLAAHWRARYQVRVVGVTGSVGKTTAKELTAAVLGQRYPALKSEGNLNTEIGVPLALLELKGHHHWAVVEMAMYARGDIALLCDIAKPSIGVVTNIGPVHLERLGSLEAIAAAKGELIEALPPDGLAVLNGDDSRTMALAEIARAHVLLYGTSPQCQVRASGITSHGLQGISFRLTWSEVSVPVELRVPSRHHVYPALAAATVALAEGFTPVEAAEALAQTQPSLRLRVLPGLRGSTILDDSYNASPASVLAALDLLAEMPGRRIALLGDMLELGPAEQEGHRQVGKSSARVCQALFLVGERAHLIAEAARDAGLTDVTIFPSKEEAAADLRSRLGPHHYLLVKASRSLALETVVQALQALQAP
jgi:UDP-N-acetylmuramoyl-tripeptide--D-alanyl-D-alanine ligase